MITFLLIAMIAAGKLRLFLRDRVTGLDAVIIAEAFYILGVLTAGLLLPEIDEVPTSFPAVVLGKFRIASLGTQLIMWTTIGLAFGAVAKRLLVVRDFALQRRPLRQV